MEGEEFTSISHGRSLDIGVKVQQRNTNAGEDCGQLSSQRHKKQAVLKISYLRSNIKADMP